jgi:SMODS and SLOG-associating 2TM effector domain 1
MTPDETIRQAAAFYQKYRIENQRDYYEQRALEYDSASQQLSTVTTLLLAAAFVAGLAGALGLVINRTAWASWRRSAPRWSRRSPDGGR